MRKSGGAKKTGGLSLIEEHPNLSNIRESSQELLPSPQKLIKVVLPDDREVLEEQAEAEERGSMWLN